MAVVDRYKGRHRGWNVKHFYRWYKEDGGQRSYTWVKNTLQSQGLVLSAAKRGAHRKRRDRSPIPGMMLYQDGSSHEWVPGKKWDLIVLSSFSLVEFLIAGFNFFDWTKFLLVLIQI